MSHMQDQTVNIVQDYSLDIMNTAANIFQMAFTAGRMSATSESPDTDEDVLNPLNVAILGFEAIADNLNCIFDTLEVSECKMQMQMYLSTMSGKEAG